MGWTYLIADTRTNVIIDELPLTGVRWTKVLNGSGQLQGTVNLGDRASGTRDVYDLTRPVRRVVYAVRDEQPLWGGIIWASGYDGDKHTVDIAAADWWSYFDHRKVLEVLTLPAAATYVAGFSKIFTSQEQNTIARGLVTLAQSHTAGNIMITVDGSVSGINRAVTYEGYDLVDVGQALRDLASISDGPDIVFDVGGFDSTTGRPARIMRTGTPRLTQAGAAHRWDLGGNLLSYQWSSGGGVMATRAFAEGSGTDRGTQIAVSELTSRYADGWPLLETDDVYSGVSDFTELGRLADTLLTGYDLPVVAPRMKVAPNLEPRLGAVAVGDSGYLVLPADDEFFGEAKEIAVRVNTISVEIDEQGGETVTLSAMTDEAIV